MRNTSLTIVLLWTEVAHIQCTSVALDCDQWLKKREEAQTHHHRMARDIILLLLYNLCKWTVRFVHLRFQLCHPRLTSTDWSNEGLWSTRGAWEWRELVCVLGDSLTVSAAAADNHLHWETPASLNITGHNSHY